MSAYVCWCVGGWWWEERVADSRLLLLLTQTYGAWDQAVWWAVVVAGQHMHMGVWVGGGGRFADS